MVAAGSAPSFWERKVPRRLGSLLGMWECAPGPHPLALGRNSWVLTMLRLVWNSSGMGKRSKGKGDIWVYLSWVWSLGSYIFRCFYPGVRARDVCIESFHPWFFLRAKDSEEILNCQTPDFIFHKSLTPLVFPGQDCKIWLCSIATRKILIDSHPRPAVLFLYFSFILKGFVCNAAGPKLRVW